jgi:histidinol-phosphate/aromatic aminotransferase/cobyric acid decarboxylase-like protein
VVAERRRLLGELQRMPLDVAPSQANLLWLSRPGLSGGELAARLQRAGVTVQPGGPLGTPDRVRVAVRDAAASDRFLRAIREAV